MTSESAKEFKKELKNINKNIISAINNHCNGLKLEFISSIIFDASDEYDPFLIFTIEKDILTVQDSSQERKVKLKEIENNFLLTILEELEQGNYLTYSEEITE